METILQGILDLGGVTAAIVFDAAGQVVGHRGHAVYDRELCEQVSGSLVKAIDSIQLEQQDWESITAQFADGKLLLRNLGTATGKGYVLAVVADATLNPSFATVAIRVAASKLKKGLHDGPGAPAAASSVAPGVASSAARPPPAAPAPARPPEPVLASSGLSWSKTSVGGSSAVPVADPSSSAFLTRCAKELARHVGPMAKVYVAEAVRRVAPGTPFSMAVAAPLVEDLAQQIEEAPDREQFRKALGNP